MTVTEHDGVRVQQLDRDGPAIATPQDGLDLIGDAWSERAQVVAVPAARLDPEFFRLSSGLAGEILQKFANYRLTLAVVGDISEHVAASDALRDLVRESNRGGHAWFLPDDAALADRLAQQQLARR